MPRYSQTLAALIAYPPESDSDRATDLAAVKHALAEVEAALPRMTEIEEARVASDILALHSRLTSSPIHEFPSGAGLFRDRLADLCSALVARSAARHATDRARIRAGALRGAELLDWLGSYAPPDRDVALEHLLGIAHCPAVSRHQDPELVGYVPSGIASIVRSVAEIPITPDDVLVDVGAGPGKVTMTVHLLSGARTRGIELDCALVTQGRSAADELNLAGMVSFTEADAREADVFDATVVFMYAPFTGSALLTVMRRVEEAARLKPLVVCTLGLDLRRFEWLAERDTQDFWLSIYDSAYHTTDRVPIPPRRLEGVACDVANERECVRPLSRQSRAIGSQDQHKPD